MLPLSAEDSVDANNSAITFVYTQSFTPEMALFRGVAVVGRSERTLEPQASCGLKDGDSILARLLARLRGQLGIIFVVLAL